MKLHGGYLLVHADGMISLHTWGRFGRCSDCRWFWFGPGFRWMWRRHVAHRHGPLRRHIQ